MIKSLIISVLTKFKYDQTHKQKNESVLILPYQTKNSLI